MDPCVDGDKLATCRERNIDDLSAAYDAFRTGTKIAAMQTSAASDSAPRDALQCESRCVLASERKRKPSLYDKWAAKARERYANIARGPQRDSGPDPIMLTSSGTRMW